MSACRDFAKGLLARGDPAPGVELFSDEQLVEERFDGRVGVQPVRAVLSGNGLLEREGRAHEIRWLCLVEGPDRAVFFHWAPRDRAPAREQCWRGVAARDGLAGCLRDALATAEAEEGAALARAREQARALDATREQSRAGQTLEASERAWRSWTEAECARVAEDAAGGPDAGDFALACRVEAARTRARALGER